MIARVGYGATDSLLNRESELLVVDLTTLNGISAPNTAGTAYPLPPASNPDGLLAQLRCYSEEQLGLRKGAGTTSKELKDIYLCLRDVRGGFILYDYPLLRLAGIPPTGLSRMTAPRPLYLRPQLVDARQSYVYTAQGFDKTVVLEFIYA